MNHNNNNGYDSDDNDGFIGDNDPMFNDENFPMSQEQIDAMKEITEEPFTHPDSPFRSDLIPTDIISVATGFMMANTWHTTNWACYVAVMQEIIKDLPPYLARRAHLALSKMNHVTVQSGQRGLAIGKAVQASR